MNGAPDSVRPWRDAWWWLLLAGLLGAYPLALLFPVRSGPSLVFYFAAPVHAWVVLAACAGLAGRALAAGRGAAATPAAAPRGRVPGLLLVLAGGAAALCAWQGWRTRSPGWLAVVDAAGAFVIPVFWALAPRPWMRRGAGWLPLLALTWLLNAGHGVWQAAVGFEVVGLAGNRNWFAVLILALAPAAVGCLRQAARERVDTGLHTRRCPDALLHAASAGVWALSLGLAWRAQSRGAWLALAAYGVLFVAAPRLARVRWPWRVAAGIGLAAGAILLGGLVREPLRAALREDIRPPLWRATLRLTAAQPLLGVGSGNFRRAFVPWKSDEQRRLLQAAAVTEHPHNEPLHVAATLGWPLAAAWLLLWLLPLAMPPREPGPERLLHYVAFLLFVHGLFDQTLVQPPANVLGSTALGLLWARWLARGAPVSGAARAAGPDGWAGRRLRCGLTALALAAALAVSLPAGLHSWRLRQGWCAEARHDWPGAYAAYARAAGAAPWLVQADLLAGSVAANRLREPAVALNHFARVHAHDPNYAHLNGEIGAALGALGHHAEARSFLAREAELFPYDATAGRRLLVCCLALDDDAASVAAAARLPGLDRRRAVRALGAVQVVALARTVTAAVPGAAAGAELRTAVAAAQVLTGRDVHEWLPDPVLARLPWQCMPGVEMHDVSTGDIDLVWRRLWREREAALGLSGADPVTAAVRALPADQVAPVLYQAGFEVAHLLGADGQPNGILEVRRDADVWLAAPALRTVMRGLEARSLAEAGGETAALFGLLPDAGAPAVSGLRIETDVAGGFPRHAILHDILAHEAGDACPRLEWPSVRLARFRHLRRVAGQEAGASDIRLWPRSGAVTEAAAGHAGAVPAAGAGH